MPTLTNFFSMLRFLSPEGCPMMKLICFPLAPHHFCSGGLPQMIYEVGLDLYGEAALPLLVEVMTYNLGVATSFQLEEK